MSDVANIFNAALGALNARDFVRAEERLRQVVRLDKSHVPALNLLTVVLMSTRRFADAEPFIAAAVSLNQSSDVSFYNYGLILKQLGKPQQALDQFSRALELNPNVPETWNNRGAAYNDLKRYELAVLDFDRAIALNRRYGEAYANKAKSLAQLRRHDEALAAYDQALSIKPDLAEPWLGRGGVLRTLRHYDEALAAYDKALAVKPDLAEAWLGRGGVFSALKRYAEAMAAYDRALSIKPDLAEAWLARGNVFTDLRRYEEALSSYDKALSVGPDLEGVWLGRGNVFWSCKRYDEAFAAYDRALAINPDLAEAWLGRGNILTDLNRQEEALSAYDKALAIKPELEGVWLGRGNVFWSLKRYDEAFAAYDKALAINPGLAEAWLGRGNVLTDMNRYDEALSAYDKALSIKPDLESIWLGRGGVFSALKNYPEAFAAYDQALSIKPDLAEAWLGRGNVFSALKRHDDAFADYERALSLRADLAEAWLGRGHALTELRRHDEAFAAYDKAFSIRPELEGVEGARLHAKMRCCDWSDFAADYRSLLAAIRSGKPSAVPFACLSIEASPEDLLQCANLWAQRHAGLSGRGNDNPKPQSGKIRVGYLSADFRTHPVAYLAAGLFESHDRSRFETCAFSIGPDDKSGLRSRLEKSFSRFVDLNNRSDAEVAETIRAADIDILVDLMGHTSGSRLRVLAQRPAPILAGYLGFAGTVGGELLDYVIADRTVIPAEHQRFFSEKILHLPYCFMPHDGTGRAISDRAPKRQDHDLPDDGFVFCCFNNAYKINPEVFGTWMAILRAVDRSVLWLSGQQQVVVDNLRREAEARGIDSARLVFARRVDSSADHLARYRLADLFLDTSPYNAHTTAGDALWAGVPVLTRIGETFAGRVAASLLNAAGLPELIAHSADEYRAVAIEMAQDRGQLLAIRERLGRNRLTGPLFDTALFTRHMEAAYEAIYRRHHAGLPPDHIEIQPITNLE